MGVMAHNAGQQAVAIEAIASGARNDAIARVARMAKFAPGPIAALAEALADAEGAEAQRAAYEALEKEARKAAIIAKKTYQRHAHGSDKDMGDFGEAFGKLTSLLSIVTDIGRQLDLADLHDVIAQDLRSIEKGLRETGL